MEELYNAQEVETKTARYFSTDVSSFIDPRAAIIAVVSFAVVVVSLDSFWALGLSLITGVALLLMSRKPKLSTVKRMAAMDGFIILMLIMLPFTTTGEVWFILWGLQASWEGLFKAVIIALKANSIVLFLLVFLGSIEPVRLGQAFYRLRAPEKLVQLFLFTVRYIDVLREEYHRSRIAMKARAFRPSNSLHTLSSFGYLLGMMLVRSMERSERVLQAMKCRGFVGHWPHMDDLRFNWFDWGGLLLLAFYLIILLWIELL